jgi:hypothetical protein
MNRKNLTAAVLAGLAGVAGVASTAQAVNLNPDGLGEVLIYPYYTVNDGNTTLLTVVNTTDRAKATKVRFIEGHNSREVLDFNLYLSAYDVWVAALGDGGDLGYEDQAGVPHIVIPDTSCTVPYLYGMGVEAGLDFGLQAFLPYAYTGNNADGGPSDIGRASEGYFEIIEMGAMLSKKLYKDPNDDSVTKDELGTHAARMSAAEAVTHVVKEDDDGNEYVEPADCQLLVDNWTVYINEAKPHPLAGWWATNAGKCLFESSDDPLNDGCGQADWVTIGNRTLASTVENSGGLFGSASVINVGRGTMFSYDARAVQGFDSTDDGIHFYPGTIHPSLNDGSETTAYVSDVSTNQIVTLDYDRGVDAVTAVFMHDEIANTFTIEEGLSAATEWVITMPTKNWYADPARVGGFFFYTPDPDDAGCNGWDPGEPNPYGPPVYSAGSGAGGAWLPGDPIPDASNTTPPTGEDWSTCTPIKNSELNDPVNPFTALFDGEACEPVLYQDWDREEDPSVVPGAIIPPIVSPAPPLPPRPEGTPFELCYEVNVLRFGGEDGTPVFGTESALLYTVDTPHENGWARITIGADDANCVACDSNDIEQHQDGNGLRGLPVTGFAAEQYVNGTLEGGSVLANYGGLFGHKGSVRVERCTLGSACASGAN